MYAGLGDEVGDAYNSPPNAVNNSVSRYLIHAHVCYMCIYLIKIDHLVLSIPSLVSPISVIKSICFTTAMPMCL